MNIMSMTDVDFVRSFEKLFRLVRKPISLENLSEIAGKFALIPYENLTKIVRSASETDPEKRLRMPGDVLMDYARHGAGGTCFSLTFCLQKILQAYGYTCAPRMADLGRNTNNHCCLVARMNDADYLIDPGYLITQPLPLPETGSTIHATRLYPVRLEKNLLTGGYTLATMEPDGEKHRYVLRDENCSETDFERFWRESFSWNMMHSLLVTRVLDTGRFYLHDRHARWFDTDGRKTAKIKENFDDEVARFTGISMDLVQKARNILSETKNTFKTGR